MGHYIGIIRELQVMIGWGWCSNLSVDSFVWSWLGVSLGEFVSISGGSSILFYPMCVWHLTYDSLNSLF